MWETFKDYFTAIFLQGFWWGKKTKTFVEWVQENKTTLFIILGIVLLLMILIYVPIPRGRR